jgi:2'-5' RNA ligase
MPSPRYALVAYIHSPVGEFVETLRRELHPHLPHLSAHITLLPPRCLRGSEPEALHQLEEISGRAEPFEISLGAVETFVPSTPTVYIDVAQGAARLHNLHDQFNTRVLAGPEEWSYVPHLTIAKMDNEEQAEKALQIARERWRQYTGNHRLLLDRLTFVREDAADHWIDLAPVPLGGSLVSR